MRGVPPSYYQEIRRAQAGKGAYRRFAKRMREFREAVANMVETSKPDPRHSPGFELPGARAQRHAKIVTKLRANGYRPLTELEDV